MKLNTLVKYQLSDFRNIIIVLYGILIVLNLFGTPVMVVFEGEISNSGMDMSSSFTFFVVAICCFSETFNMWIQNGISRKHIFKGFLFGTFAISAVCTILDYVLAQFFALLSKGYSTFTLLSFIFEDYFSSHNIFIEIILNLIFIFISGAASIMLGYFIAILFYRSGKFMRIGIAAGLPIFTFVILPLLFSCIYDTAFFKALVSFLYIIFGLKSGNPLYLIATLSVGFLLLSSINYLLIRKLHVKTL